jgi:hypothetical protein
MADSKRCQDCAEPIQAGWKVCPFCGRSLSDNPISAIRLDVDRPPSPSSKKKRRWDDPIPTDVPNIEKDVKTDTTVIGVILLALGILGLIGIFLYLVNAVDAKHPPVVQGVFVVGVAVVVVVSVGLALMTRRSGPGVSTAVGIFSGLATGGMIAAVVAMVVMMIVISSIMNFCATCGGLAK